MPVVDPAPTATVPSTPTPSDIPPPVQKPPVAIAIVNGRVVLTALAVRSTKAGKCPKTATETISAGQTKLTKTVAVKKVDSQCEVTSSVKLAGKLKAAKTIKVTVSGKTLRSASRTVAS